MKYLRTYKIFESNETYSFNDLLLDLKDMLAEVNDMNFITNAEYQSKPMKGDPFLIFWIGRLRSREGFTRNEKEYSMLKAELNRIKEYVDIHGYILIPYSKTDFIKHINEMDMLEFNRLMDDNRFTIDYLIKKK